MKKLALITLVTLATVCFTQAQGILTLPGQPSLPPPGWTHAWPPTPLPDPNYRPPLQPPHYPFPGPPEAVLPDQGVITTTAGLTPTPAPEPTSVALITVGGIAAFLLRRRVRVDDAA